MGKQNPSDPSRVMPKAARAVLRGAAPSSLQGSPGFRGRPRLPLTSRLQRDSFSPRYGLGSPLARTPTQRSLSPAPRPFSIDDTVPHPSPSTFFQGLKAGPVGDQIIFAVTTVGRHLALSPTPPSHSNLQWPLWSKTIIFPTAFLIFSLPGLEASILEAQRGFQGLVCFAPLGRWDPGDRQAEAPESGRDRVQTPDLVF